MEEYSAVHVSNECFSEPYEISFFNGKNWAAVPRADISRLGLLPEWDVGAFMSSGSRRSFRGNVAYLVQEDYVKFVSVFTKLNGRPPMEKKRDDKVRVQIGRLPGLTDPVDAKPLEEPTAIPYGPCKGTSGCTVLTLYNPYFQSVSDFLLYVLINWIVDEHPVQGARMLDGNLSFLKPWLRRKVVPLSGTFYDDRTRLMWVYTLRTSFPTCPVCGCEFGRLKNIHLSKSYDAYGPHCSSRCAALDPDVRRKMAESSISRYGVPVPQRSSTVKNRIRATNRKKYGVEHPLQRDEVLDHVLELRMRRQRKEHRPTLDGIVFDSGWERDFYAFCRREGLSVEYHPCRLPYESGGTRHWYYPDFRVEGRLYEVKGGCFIQADGSWTCPFKRKGESEVRHLKACASARAKYLCARRNGVTVVTEKDMSDLAEVLGVGAV